MNSGVRAAHLTFEDHLELLEALDLGLLLLSELVLNLRHGGARGAGHELLLLGGDSRKLLLE